LQPLATAALGRSARRPVGLQAAAAALLGCHVDKDVQLSDWEARPLTTAQLAYASADAFVCQLLYLLCCGCNNGTLRETPAPPTLDALVRLLPRPASAVPIEQARVEGLARNLAAWAKAHWASDEIVGLYAAIGSHFAPHELVETAHALAVQFATPALFGAVLRQVASAELAPDTAIRATVDARLREPFYAEVAPALQADIQMRLEKSQSAHPLVGSRRFNRLLGGLVRAVLTILGRPLVSAMAHGVGLWACKKAVSRVILPSSHIEIIL
jgi:hypothetical protein